MKCPTCGCENARGVQLCFSCNNTIPMKRIAPLAYESSNPKGDRVKTIIAVVLFIVAIVLCIRAFAIIKF